MSAQATMPRAMTVAEEKTGTAAFREAHETASDHARLSSAPFLLETAESPGAFGDLWPDLATLAERPKVRAYPFQCRDHLEIWFETIGRANRVVPYFVKVVTADGELLMLLPLGVRRQAGVRILEFLDCGVADYNAPVLFAAAARLAPADARIIWNSVQRSAPRFDIAVLQKMPQTIADFTNPLHALCTQRWSQSGHIVRLDGDVGKLQPGVQRRDSRRRRKHMAEHGEVAFHIAGESQEIERIFDVFLRQKKAHYRESLGTDGFDIPGQIDYYHILTRRLSGRGVQLAFLTVGESVVATAWSFLAGRRVYYMMPAYERGQWRNYSPGRLLLDDLVEWAAGNGMEAFDFGIGDEDYKLRWSGCELALSGLSQPATLRGHAYRAALGAREALRGRLPAPLRRLAKTLLSGGRRTG